MNADTALKAALDGLGVPAERMTYNGKAATYITYQAVLSTETAFADDDNEAEEFVYRIDIFSRGDYVDLLRRTKQALKAAGFYEVSALAELYEPDTKYYHIPINATYLEEGAAGA